MSPLRKNYCEDANSLLHSLDCEHVVKTPSSSSSLLSHASNTTTTTTTTTPKAPCSPNCTRSIYVSKPQLPLSWLKQRSDMCEARFVCPICIEEQVRQQYGMFLQEAKGEGGNGARGKVTDDVETNVWIWVYGAVVDAVGMGGRVCEGVHDDGEDGAGVFCFKYLEGFRALGRQRSDDDVRCGGWDMRLGAEEAGMGIEGLEEGVYEGCAAKEGLGMVDMRKESQTVDGEMEGLAERLIEVRVGVREDGGVDGLVEGVARL